MAQRVRVDDPVYVVEPVAQGSLPAAIGRPAKVRLVMSWVTLRAKRRCPLAGQERCALWRTPTTNQRTAVAANVTAKRAGGTDKPLQLVAFYPPRASKAYDHRNRRSDNAQRQDEEADGSEQLQGFPRCFDAERVRDPNSGVSSSLPGSNAFERLEKTSATTASPATTRQRLEADVRPGRAERGRCRPSLRTAPRSILSAKPPPVRPGAKRAGREARRWHTRQQALKSARARPAASEIQPMGLVGRREATRAPTSVKSRVTARKMKGTFPVPQTPALSTTRVGLFRTRSTVDADEQRHGHQAERPGQPGGGGGCSSH